MAYATSFVWDGNGNRTKQYDSGALTTRTFAANNSLLSAQSLGGPLTMISSDAVGNRILETSTLGSVTMSWTPENKLAVTQLPSGEVITSTFADDGVRRTKNDSGTLTVYTMDEMNTLLETDGANVLKNRYVTYPDNYGGLASQHVSGSSNFFLFDSSSNTRALLSALGAPTDIYSSTVFGVELLSGSGTVNSRRFGGQVGYVRDFLNRYQIGQRPYDAVTGAWMSMDPIGWDGGQWNWMQFVENEPVSVLDPIGLASLIRKGSYLEPFHFFIRVKNCAALGGEESIGFYPAPDSNAFWWNMGQWRIPDDHGSDDSDLHVADRYDDPIFDELICWCISDECHRQRLYMWPLYQCASAVNDIWGCAQARYAHPVPGTKPLRPKKGDISPCPQVPKPPPPKKRPNAK